MTQDYANQRVTVMGLGRFGGGIGVTRFLVERGADVLVTDTLPAEELADSVAQIADLPGVELRLGQHNVSDFTTCDLVVVNPAVKPDNRFVHAAQAANIPITSEIRLLVKHLPNRLRTIGITGSAGKSTTTAMVGHILRKTLGQPGETPLETNNKSTPNRNVQGPGVWVGGNLGGSLLPHVQHITPDDWVVLELSSFMLEGLRDDQWSPHIAVVTNISPNHLDWHGSMENYIAAKQAIFDFQNESDIDQYADLGVLDRSARGRLKILAADGWTEPDDMANLYSFSIPQMGIHNRKNALFAAIAVSHALCEEPGKKGLEHLFEKLQDFPGLPHRLQFVGQIPSRGVRASARMSTPPQGINCYNDSKSTTPEAAQLAIESFAPGQVHLILGGYDKGSNFEKLATLAAQRCAGVYTLGDTGDTIAALIENAIALNEQADAATRPDSCGGVNWPADHAQVTRCQTLDRAVAAALADAKPGQALVLSPGCASWDQFTNYEQRGDQFCALVQAATP